MPRPVKTARGKKAERKGRRAETLCAWLLRCKGYRILARRYRTPVGELDIVAKRGAVLVFVEIKSRASLAAAAEAISPRQQARLARAAEAFLGRRPDLIPGPTSKNAAMRFDAMLLGRGGFPRHVKDAWRVGFEGVR